MSFYIEQGILETAPRTRLAVVEVEGVKVGFGHASLDDMRLRVVNKIRDDIQTANALKNTPQIAGLDQLIGHFDANMRRNPTLAELLLRKILDGGTLPVENDAVDAAVLLSLFYKLPVMIRDRATLKGDIGLVVGRSNRPFEVMQGHDAIRTEGRLFLKDDVGYFASPIAQGKRGIVTERTHDILLMALFPENVGDSIVEDFIRRGGNWLESLCGGQVSQEGMVGHAETAE